MTAPRQAPVLPGTLYVVATPIGNLEDITYRAVRVLGEVDLVAAEDTRSARVLLSRYGLSVPTQSYFSGNEARRTEQLLGRLREGAAVALISEAGMPGVSDPGARLVARCVAEGIAVDVLPGPSAVVTALLLAGLPAERFSFFGFLPRKGRARQECLGALATAPGAVVLYEAPRRVAATLAELGQALGEARQVALVREMTKVHQEVWRGSLGELAARAEEQGVRGEVTLVLAPAAPPDPEAEAEALEQTVARRLERGESPRSVADALAHRGRRKVYQLALKLRDR